MGFSLGLTGGGGAIFAVPLLVYGLGVPAREAVGVSLLTVGSTSLVGFRATGVAGHGRIPDGLAVCHCRHARCAAGIVAGRPNSRGGAAEPVRGAHARDRRSDVEQGQRRDRSLADHHGRQRGPDLSPRSRRQTPHHLAMRDAARNRRFGAGVLSGMFGVGGGFIIVPALVMFSGMGMQRAIGTSLLVITLISASGTANHLLAGKDLILATAGVFTAGSIAGLFAGSVACSAIGRAVLQRVFAAAIVVVACMSFFAPFGTRRSFMRGLALVLRGTRFRRCDLWGGCRWSSFLSFRKSRALAESCERPKRPSRRGAERRSSSILLPTVNPTKLNKGLESVARYLNLNAEAGHKPADVKLALVLHGSATKAALGDAAYAKHTAATKNPNLELIHELKACGVEVFVCGQSLARNKFASADVAGDVHVAVSAMTVNANKQLDGYAYLSIH